MVRHERKPMRKSHASRIVVLSLVLLFVCSGSFAQDMKFPPPPGGGHSGICTDGTYLYVIHGPGIFKYSLSDMTQQAYVALPIPEAPADVSMPDNESGLPGPPPGPGPAGICTDGVNLYVLLGGSILQYSLSTLTLQNTTDLPLPELPQSE